MRWRGRTEFLGDVFQKLFGRAAEKALDHLCDGVLARFLAAQFGLVAPSASGAAARNNLLARQTVHDSHNRGVGARLAARQRLANVPHSAFFEPPKRGHAVELQRSQFEQLALPREAAARIPVCRRNVHCLSFGPIVREVAAEFVVAAGLAAPAAPNRPPGFAAACADCVVGATLGGALSRGSKYAALFSKVRRKAAFRSVHSSCV